MMTSTFDEAAKILRLKIEGTLLIQDLEELRGIVLGLMSKGCRVVFDLSGVAEIDSAGLQFLFAVKKKTALDGGSFALFSPSIPVMNLLNVYDLTGQFETGEGA